MQLRHLGIPACLNLRRFVIEDFGQLLDRLPLPLHDQIGMQLMPARKVRDRPCIASSATFALNSAVKRLRVFMMVRPSHRRIHLNRLSQEPAPALDIGNNGLTIPVRNRNGVRSLVSFTSNHSKGGWAKYKSRNMPKLQPIAALIHSAAGINFKLTPEPVELSKREEECLIWAARGKTFHDIAALLEFVVRQREDLSGYRAAQTELHKPDPRGRRRHRDRSHTCESAEMAGLS